MTIIIRKIKKLFARMRKEIHSRMHLCNKSHLKIWWWSKVKMKKKRTQRLFYSQTSNNTGMLLNKAIFRSSKIKKDLPHMEPFICQKTRHLQGHVRCKTKNLQNIRRHKLTMAPTTWLCGFNNRITNSTNGTYSSNKEQSRRKLPICN